MSILTKAFDHMAAPAPLVDKMGYDAYAKNGFQRFISHADFIVPLLATTSAFAIQFAVTGMTDIAENVANVAIGYGIYRTVKWAGPHEKTVANAEKNYYLDRRLKINPFNTPSPETIYDLNKKRRSGLFASWLSAGTWGSIGAVNIALYGTPQTLTMVVACAQISYFASQYWRARQALEGNWRILEDLPKIKEPEKVPAAAQLHTARAPL